jgi:hypothetical protein
MATESPQSESVSPPRTDIQHETFAIHVTDAHVIVWQYRLTLSAPDGEWHLVETLDQDNAPRLSLDYATVHPPDDVGYWIYSKSYDCALDCE